MSRSRDDRTRKSIPVEVKPIKVDRLSRLDKEILEDAMDGVLKDVTIEKVKHLNKK